jgi:hypothetical protein
VTASLAFAGIIASLSVWLSAQSGPQPAFGALILSPSNVVYNTPTAVSFKIRIDTPTLNPTTVELQRLNSEGLLVDTLGRLYDDGTHTDQISGDKTFAATFSLDEPNVGRSYFRVVAAFRGNRANALSAIVSLDVDPFALPPDPGDAGKRTLVGVDSDQDGLRDDVQRFVAVRFYDKQPLLDAMRQVASSQQDFVVEPNPSRATMTLAASRRHDALDCLAYVANDGADLAAGVKLAYELNRQLKAVLLNTPERSKAFFRNDSVLGGTTATMTNPETWHARCR